MKHRIPALFRVSKHSVGRPSVLTVVVDESHFVVAHHPADCVSPLDAILDSCSYIFMTSVSILLLGLLILPCRPATVLYSQLSFDTC